MKMFKTVLASVFIILTGCGGDDSSSPTPTNSTGVLLDGPVISIGYKTETKQGVTNSLGEYEYLPGESVTFFIGDLVFPTVKASGVVTPLELAGATDTSDPTVVNMIRLLQTLDKNADHSDGIEITEAAITAATQVDFNLTVAEFAASPAVLALITSVGVTELISEAEAIQNFEDTLYSVNLTEITASSSIEFSGCLGVIGGWDYSFTDTSMTVVGTDSWSPSCALGPEETVTVNMTSLAADFDVPFNCESYPICTSEDFNKTIMGIDGDGRSFTSTYSFDRENSVLTYIKETDDSTYTEVITWSNSIVGSWLIPTNGGQAVITFFADGSYVHAEDGTADPSGQDGMERGTYTWDVATGAFATTCPTVDTNGEWGLSHGGGGLTCDGSTADGTITTVTIDNNTLTLGGTTAERVVP